MGKTYPDELQGESDCLRRGRPRQCKCPIRAAARAIAPARASARAPEGTDAPVLAAPVPVPPVRPPRARASPSARARGVCGSSRPPPQPLAATDGRDDANRAPAA